MNCATAWPAAGEAGSILVTDQNLQSKKSTTYKLTLFAKGLKQQVGITLAYINAKNESLIFVTF
jgi:hypothetical protein